MTAPDKRPAWRRKFDALLLLAALFAVPGAGILWATTFLR